MIFEMKSRRSISSLSVQNDIFKCPSISINSRYKIYVEGCQDGLLESNVIAAMTVHSICSPQLNMNDLAVKGTD